MKTTEQKIAELKQLIDTNLNDCDSIYTPTICQIKETPKAKAELAENILKRCMETGCTVQAAINNIEKEFNPNFILD